jgi:hypothetical protein
MKPAQTLALLIASHLHSLPPEGRLEEAAELHRHKGVKLGQTEEETAARVEALLEGRGRQEQAVALLSEAMRLPESDRPEAAFQALLLMPLES